MFFCYSYASWEKRTVENTNGRIRRIIPKGVSIAAYSDKEIAEIEFWLIIHPENVWISKLPMR